MTLLLCRKFKLKASIAKNEKGNHCYFIVLNVVDFCPGALTGENESKMSKNNQWQQDDGVGGVLLFS